MPSLIIPTNPQNRDYPLIYDAIDYFFDTFLDQEHSLSLLGKRAARVATRSIPHYLLDAFLVWFREAKECSFDLQVMEEEIDSAPLILAIEEHHQALHPQRRTIAKPKSKMQPSKEQNRNVGQTRHVVKKHIQNPLRKRLKLDHSLLEEQLADSASSHSRDELEYQLADSTSSQQDLENQLADSTSSYSRENQLDSHSTQQDLQQHSTTSSQQDLEEEVVDVVLLDEEEEEDEEEEAAAKEEIDDPGPILLSDNKLVRAIKAAYLKKQGRVQYL